MPKNSANSTIKTCIGAYKGINNRFTSHTDADDGFISGFDISPFLSIVPTLMTLIYTRIQ